MYPHVRCEFGRGTRLIRECDEKLIFICGPNPGYQWDGRLLDEPGSLTRYRPPNATPREVRNVIERTYTGDVSADDAGNEVSIAGHVHEIRDLGSIAFVLVRDREGVVQVVVKEEEDGALLETVKALNREDVVRVAGVVKASDQAPGGVELSPRSLDVINEARKSPALEVAKDIDADRSVRLDNRFLDLRKPEVSAIFSLRSKAIAAMSEWFDQHDYYLVDTPTISQAGAEGGAELFPVVYYGHEAYLSQSPQLYKQLLMAAGFDAVYEVGKAFRAEDFGTSRHVSEITMFDVELAYVEDHHDVMDVQEESLRYTLERVAETAQREQELLDAEVTVPEEEFPRISFDEARDILAAEFDHEPDDPADLDSKGERLLGEHFAERGHEAFFVVGFPEEKFYYMQDVEGDDVASRKFDLIYRGQEISSGGQREHDLDRLLASMDEQGVSEDDFEFFLEAFQYGVPPHGGYGLGIDRLVQKAAELDNIREAILFPRDPDRLTP